MSVKSFAMLVAWLCTVQVLVLWPGSSRAEDYSNAEMRNINMTYSVTVPNIPADAKQVTCWLPLPQTDIHQTVNSYKLLGDFEYTVVSESEYGNHFLLVDLTPAAGSTAELSVVYNVDRQRVGATNLNAGDNSKEIIKRYLAADSMIPLGGQIELEAREVIKGEDDPLKQARLLYENIVATVTYDKPPGGKHGRGDAMFACNERYGNCTDFHSLFIGEARSLGIPSRFHMGIPFPMDANEGEIGGYHCWAEFWIDGYGWIPIDASEAHKNKARVDELFGGLDASRIRFSTGRDIMLPQSKIGHVNFIIYPYVEADGEPLKADKSFSFVSVDDHRPRR